MLHGKKFVARVGTIKAQGYARKAGGKSSARWQPEKGSTTAFSCTQAYAIVSVHSLANR